jgi:hypothetical protein
MHIHENSVFPLSYIRPTELVTFQDLVYKIPKYHQDIPN